MEQGPRHAGSGLASFEWQSYPEAVGTYRDGRLAGGLWGVAVGPVFGVISMFHRFAPPSWVGMNVLPGRGRQRRGTALALLPVQRSAQVPVPTQEATMAHKSAGPGRSGDTASRGNKPGAPNRAKPGDQAKPGNGAGRPDKATPEDEVQSRFREALDRKRAREAGTTGGPGRQDDGKIHSAHGPARNRRSFRRKSG